MRGREINYTFWGEPIDTNWYENERQRDQLYILGRTDRY